MQFLQTLAKQTITKQEDLYLNKQSLIRFPQIFQQAFIITSGKIDDIDYVIKELMTNQWGCLPIQVTFIQVYNKSIHTSNLSSLKLRDAIIRYNDLIAGWQQLSIKFLGSKDQLQQIEAIGSENQSMLPKTVEDYMFSNQLVTQKEIKNVIPVKNLLQESYQQIIQIIEQRHQNLFEIVSKKLGMTKNIFDKVVQSGDIFEWSISATLNASYKHDNQVIEEVDYEEEFT